jgi:hypothetical protein
MHLLGRGHRPPTPFTYLQTDTMTQQWDIRGMIKQAIRTVQDI